MTRTDPVPTTPGLHHVSVLAGEPRPTLGFWTATMGQRLVKRTINYDDPGMHHLYFGDGEGTVGTALTFFPIPNAAPHLIGTGETSAVGYHVHESALPGWRRRLAAAGTPPVDLQRWDRPGLAFDDPSGLHVELIGHPAPPDVHGWPDEPIGPEERLRGLSHVTLRLARADATVELLERYGYAVHDERPEGSARRLRLTTADHGLGTAVEIVEEGRDRPRRNGRGTVHHVAFRLPGDAEQAAVRDDLLALGLQVSEVRDRRYFRSIYVREPGGVLFEFATDGPGVGVDESPEELGGSLRLPDWLEPRRDEIASRLPEVTT